MKQIHIALLRGSFCEMICLFVQHYLFSKSHSFVCVSQADIANYLHLHHPFTVTFGHSL